MRLDAAIDTANWRKRPYLFAGYRAHHSTKRWTLSMGLSVLSITFAGRTVPDSRYRAPLRAVKRA